ncbi:hypothetical protein Hte_000243 [Hypoxylon texense]
MNSPRPETGADLPPPSRDPAAVPAAVDTSTSAPTPCEPVSIHASMLVITLLAALTSWDVLSIAMALPVITSELEEETPVPLWSSLLSIILGSLSSLLYFLGVICGATLKQILYLSSFYYTTGSIMVAITGSSYSFIVGRLTQGFGVAGLEIFRRNILDVIITSPEERQDYSHAISLAYAVGTTAGPFVGAVFSELVSWKMIGLVNCLLVGGVLSFSFLAHLPPIQITLRTPDRLGLLSYVFGLLVLVVPFLFAGQLVLWFS